MNKPDADKYPEEHLEQACKFDVDIMFRQYHTMMAIAKFLDQMHICGHGIRGFCPYCHRNGEVA